MLSKVVHGVKSNTKDLRMLDSRYSLALDGDGEGSTTFIAGCSKDCGRGFLSRDLQTTLLKPVGKLVKVWVNLCTCIFYVYPRVEYLAVISIGDYADVSRWCWEAAHVEVEEEW